jgi:hypothetical protein
MEAKPRSRRGILVFCFVFLAVAGAISATVLLANNRRNLNHLMRSLGIDVTERMLIPKPGTMEKFKGKRLKGVALMIDPHIFMPEIKGLDSAFMRNMHKDGENLCTLFARLGFKMSEWKPGSFAKSVNECYYEETIANPEKPDEPSTFFLMIKGAPDGTLISTRVKIIFTDATARAKLVDMAAQVLTEYAKATNWTEIGEERNKLQALQPFATSLSGVSAKFSSEFSGAGRYNLIFAKSSPLSKAEKRTDAFFDRASFLPLTPDYGGPPIVDKPVKS